MHWVLLDLAIYALAVLLVAGLGFLLYKHVRVLLRAVKAASSLASAHAAGLRVNTPPKR
ncbi:MAG: hypothetical protein JWO22_860 [Frankiales bacterium]|nr:hypothetical protein [Frankiales bacterium]